MHIHEMKKWLVTTFTVTESFNNISKKKKTQKCLE